MIVSEKMSLIDKIGRELQAKFTYSEINIFLSEYNIAHPKEITINSKWSYSKSALQGVPVEKLVKISIELGIDIRAVAPSYFENNSADNIKKKAYYSVRTGKNPMSSGLDLRSILDIFKSFYSDLEYEGYFQEYLGFHCIDQDFVPGKLGRDIESTILIEVRKKDLFPVHDYFHSYSEDDLFDVIEFLYDHCSKPVRRTYHSYGDCGWHCETFEREPGRKDFRES